MSTDEAGRPVTRLPQFVRRLDPAVATAFACILLLLLLGSLYSTSFLSPDYLLQQLKVASFLGVIATGMMIVVLLGQIDLSVPWVVAVGGMMAAAAGSDQPRQFRDFLSMSGIDVREILRGEFLKQSAQATRFPQVVEQGGDAVVQLDIEDYGLAPGFSLRPFDKPLSATLRVAARMTTAEGKVLWQKMEFVTNLNAETESHKFDAWLADPALAERGFRKAAEIVVAGLLAEFTAAPEPVRVDASGKPRPVTPLFGPDAKRFERGHDTGGNVRFESEPGGDGRCSSYAACGNRDPSEVNRKR